MNNDPSAMLCQYFLNRCLVYIISSGLSLGPPDIIREIQRFVSVFLSKEIENVNIEKIALGDVNRTGLHSNVFVSSPPDGLEPPT
jgi:hypothetical protein